MLPHPTSWRSILILSILKRPPDDPLLVRHSILIVDHNEKTRRVLCGHCFSPALKKGNKSPPDQRMVQMTTTIHTKDLMLSEPNDYKITLRFDGPPFDGPLNAATPSVAKEVLTRKKQSLSAFVRYDTLSGHWKCFWRPEIRKCYMSTVIPVLQTWLLLGRQTDGNCMNMARHCAQSVKLFFRTMYCVGPQHYNQPVSNTVQYSTLHSVTDRLEAPAVVFKDQTRPDFRNFKMWKKKSLWV